MTTVLDVAKYILEKQGEMSTWKLQKLCYYAQAWHYTWTEKRLIREDFQAWRNGPVCPELFKIHQGKFMIGEADIQGSTSNLSEEEKESVKVVLKDYGAMNPYELSSLTHMEKPWQEARADLPADAPSHAVINLESMGEYYGSLV